MADRLSERQLPPKRPPAERPVPERQLAQRPLPAPVNAAQRPLPPADRPAPPRPGRPDPRPMRVVYGASAVAAMGVIAVGLFQPAYAPAPPADANPQANPAGGNGNGAQTAQTNVVVKHVTKYIHLKPGQSAPPGATVITQGAPAPRVVVTHNSTPANPPAARPPAANPPPAARPPAANPPPAAPPPAPPVRTRQSGRP